ncbi:MAG: bacterial Ig-like domain-containing protein [Treponema sp.]|nr:bacterial Ig-like domain-containing protein [Treponema sp.]
MKKMKKWGSLFAALTVLVSFAFTGCEPELGDKDKRASVEEFAVTNLTVSGMKTIFAAGEEFSTEGAVVKAVFADDETKEEDVTGKAKFSLAGHTFTASEAGNTVKVVVSYKQGSCDYNVSVTLPVTEVAVAEGSVLYSYSADSSTYFVVGQSAAYLKLTYSDGSSDSASVHADEAAFTNVTSTSATMTYSGVSATVELTSGKTMSELLTAGATASELLTAGAAANDLLTAGAAANELIATGKDLYDSSNSTSDWLGNDDTGYLLNVAKVASSAYIEDDSTYGKVINAYAAQSTTTAPNMTGAKVTASNPLSGTSATSVTLVARVKNAAGQNGYDALLSFTGADEWNACAIMEAGGVHANSAGFFDNVAAVWTDADWHTVTVIMTATTYSLYIDGVEKASDTITDGSSWANTYWGTTCTTMAVGAGFTGTLWTAGYVDDGAYISDVALFPRALSSDEIAAMN